MGVLSSMVPALCAVAAVCCASAPLSAAQAGVVRTKATSVAQCDVVAATDASSQSAEVIASVAASTAAFVCEQNRSMSEAETLVQSRDIALATADSFARAVASISVDCYISGTSSIKINGRSVAMASAFSIAQAYVKAVADADACDSCDATAKLVAERNQELWLEAVAIAEVRIDTATYRGIARSIWIEEFVESVLEGTASAFAEVIAGSYSSTEEGCQVFIKGEASVDANTQDDRAPSTFSCELNVSAAEYEFAIDSVANASRQATIYACEEPSDYQANITAREVATAVASAIAMVSLQCEVPTPEHVSGAGVVCALGAAQAVAVAEASAYAWAEGYVKALAQCDESLCVASAGNIASDIATLVLTAHAEVIERACAGQNETFDVMTTEAETVADSVEAVATVLLSARITWYGQECEAASDVSSYIIGTPASGRVPTPLPVLPANASTGPFPLVIPTIITSDGTLTANGSASTVETSAEHGATATGNATEFSETVVALRPCGEGPCVTNYGQCSGEIRGQILEKALPCCGRVFECVKQSSVYGLCMPKGQKAPPDWDGEVLAGYCGY